MAEAEEPTLQIYWFLRSQRHVCGFPLVGVLHALARTTNIFDLAAVSCSWRSWICLAFASFPFTSLEDGAEAVPPVLCSTATVWVVAAGATPVLARGLGFALVAFPHRRYESSRQLVASIQQTPSPRGQDSMQQMDSRQAVGSNLTRAFTLGLSGSGLHSRGVCDI